MISPIQKQVFAAIEAYAKQVGADLVFDSANNPTLLYNNPAVERTQQVIDALKKNANDIAAKKKGADVIFLRKILRGGADQSYGIEVARLAGVPEGVIRRAREILTELEGGQGVHPQPAQTPEEDQFSLAELGSRAVLDRLEQTDVNALSPIQALNLLDELKRMLEG